MGFRGPQVRSANTHARVIACIGGSTTVAGDTDDATYPAMLQRYLNAHNGPESLVVNCGISGMDARSYGHPLHALFRRLQPDVVVEYNGVNDICWDLFSHWKSQLNQFERMILSSAFLRWSIGDHFLPDDDVIRQDINDRVIRPLQSVASTLKERFVRFYVCSFICPDPTDAPRSAYSLLDSNLRYHWEADYMSYSKYVEIVNIYNKALKEAFDGHYIPLAESDTFPVDQFFDICHMTPDGIATKARRLAELLQDKLRRKRAS